MEAIVVLIGFIGFSVGYIVFKRREIRHLESQDKE